MKTRDMAYIALMAVLISVCSWLSVPSVIPFTMQTFGVFCALLLLGGRRGSIAVLLYIVMGAVGLPVFSNFAGGVGKLMGPSGGYIFGFLLTALCYWAMTALLGEKTLIKYSLWRRGSFCATPSERCGSWRSTPAPSR